MRIVLASRMVAGRLWRPEESPNTANFVNEHSELEQN